MSLVSPMLAALITWWTVRGELLMVPVAAVVVVLACTLWAGRFFDLERSSSRRTPTRPPVRRAVFRRENSFFVRCSNTRCNRCRVRPIRCCPQAVYRRGVAKVELFAQGSRARLIRRRANIRSVNCRQGARRRGVNCVDFLDSRCCRDLLREKYPKSRLEMALADRMSVSGGGMGTEYAGSTGVRGSSFSNQAALLTRKASC